MSDEPLRYDRIAIALHWLIGAALLAQIVFGFELDHLAPRGTPGRAGVINLHKSVGIVLGLLVLVRLGWRLAHPPPAWGDTLDPRRQQHARLGHRALYACMVAVPLAGYLASNFTRYGIRFFGHAWPAWGRDDPGVYAVLNGAHVLGAWLFATLVAGHVAIALEHLLIERDDVFARVWPFAHRPPSPPRTP